MDIVHVVEITTTPDRLYETLSTERGLAGWWTAHTKAEPKVGAVNEFGFGPDRTFRLRVDALDPARRVAWTNVQGPPDWEGTRISFEIRSDAEGKTSLRFVHSGFREADDMFGVYSFAWAQFLRSLKLLCETGKGEPFVAP